MNVAPSTSDPRAARRTSCLGTFVLVVVLWSVSVVALASYLVTRSAIVRQVRFAWWAVFLAATALLAVEVAIFEAIGDGLTDLLRLHIHPWWLLAHGYGIGSLVTWPLTILCLPGTLEPPGGRHGGRPVGGAGGAAGRRGRLERLQPTPSPGRRGPRHPQRGPGDPPPPRAHQPCPDPGPGDRLPRRRPVPLAPQTRTQHRGRDPGPRAAAGHGRARHPRLGQDRHPAAAGLDRRSGRHAGHLRGLQGHRPGVGLAGHLRLPPRQPRRHRRLLAYPGPGLLARGRHGHRQPAPGGRGLGQRRRRPLLPAHGHPGPPARLHPTLGPTPQQSGLPAPPRPQETPAALARGCDRPG